MQRTRSVTANVAAVVSAFVQLETVNMLCRFKKAARTMTTLLKVNGDNAKRKNKVAQMQKAAVSDSEEDEGVAEQMEVAARQQANALQAEEGDPEPVVLQQVLFHIQVSSQPGQPA